MEDAILLENPRRRRRKKKASARRRRPARRRTTRRRRRNPATVARRRPARRRRSTTRRRRVVARNPFTKRRRRRRNPSGGRGGRVLSVNRAMNIVKDGAGFAGAEFLGDIAARALYFKVPQVDEVFRKMGVDGAMGQKWLQLALAIFAGPTLRKFKFIPAPVLKHWETANAASALIGLTYGWREQAYGAMQLEGYGGPGLADWVTTNGGGGAPAPQIAAPASDGLSDWATVDGSASYTGDPFSA